MNIGNQIKALRLRKGVTQEAVAQHFGLNCPGGQQMGVRHVCAGHRDAPRSVRIFRCQH